MKKIKLTKKLYNMLPSEILVAIKAYSVKDRRMHAHVSHVYINPKDEAKLKKYAAKVAKKDSLLLLPKAVEMAVGMEFLNYGPVTNSDVPEGYLLYDKEAAQEEFKKNL